MTLKYNQDTYRFIAQQIGINVEDVETTLSLINSIYSHEPEPPETDIEPLEVVKVWKIKQTLPEVFLWWEILLYTPVVDMNEEYYLLFEVSEWGVNSRDSFEFLEGRTFYTDIAPSQTKHNTIDLLFDNDEHDEFL